MPNSYRHFESGEVSRERLRLEIELLKNLQRADLLHDLDWTLYDTPARILFVEAGLHAVHGGYSKEPIRRLNQTIFIQHCLRQHPRSFDDGGAKQQRVSRLFMIHLIFLLVSLVFLIAFAIYNDVRPPLLASLDAPLTSKRRHLSFTDDLVVVLLAAASGIALGCVMVATRFRRRIVLLGIFLQLIMIVLLIAHVDRIARFLSRYRERRWPLLYDYMYS